MKTMWLSDAPWASSAYGKIVRQVVWELQARGFPQSVSCKFGLEGGVLEFGGITYYPQGTDHSQRALIGHAKHWGADMIFVNFDIWPLQQIGKLAAEAGMGLVWYCPVDVQEVNRALRERLKESLYTVAMSNHAEKEIRKAGFDNVRTITPGVDTDLFVPLTNREEKPILREVLGFAGYDAVIGIVKMNKDDRRSGLALQLHACKIAQENLPDLKIGIYMHTLPTGPSGAIHIPEVLANLGFQEHEVRFPDAYQYFLGLSEPEMAKLYNGFDVLCMGTFGEGFGIPVIEAMSCGVPVVAPNHSALTELMKPLPELQVPIATTSWTPVPGKMGTYDPYLLADRLETALVRIISPRSEEHTSELQSR